MQTYSKSNKKATFPAIWAGLSGWERTELTARLMAEMRIASNTARNWGLGHSRPSSFSDRKEAARIINDYCSGSAAPEELFPDK